MLSCYTKGSSKHRKQVLINCCMKTFCRLSQPNDDVWFELIIWQQNVLFLVFSLKQCHQKKNSWSLLDLMMITMVPGKRTQSWSVATIKKSPRKSPKTRRIARIKIHRPLHNQQRHFQPNWRSLLRGFLSSSAGRKNSLITAFLRISIALSY